MKELFAYILLVLFAAMSLQQAAVAAVFFSNQDYVTEKFCVNKDKPELNCKGKCHMKNMLVQTAEKETQNAQLNVEVMIPVFFCESTIEFPILLVSEFVQIQKNRILYDSYESWMFQPPRA